MRKNIDVTVNISEKAETSVSTIDKNITLNIDKKILSTYHCRFLIICSIISFVLLVICCIIAIKNFDSSQLTDAASFTLGGQVDQTNSQGTCKKSKTDEHKNFGIKFNYNHSISQNIILHLIYITGVSFIIFAVLTGVFSFINSKRKASLIQQNIKLGYLNKGFTDTLEKCSTAEQKEEIVDVYKTFANNVSKE